MKPPRLCIAVLCLAVVAVLNAAQPAVTHEMRLHLPQTPDVLSKSIAARHDALSYSEDLLTRWKDLGGTQVVIPTLFYSGPHELADPRAAWKVLPNLDSLTEQCRRLQMPFLLRISKVTKHPMTDNRDEMGALPLVPMGDTPVNLLPALPETTGVCPPEERLWIRFPVTAAEAGRHYHIALYTGGPVMFRIYFDAWGLSEFVRLHPDGNSECNFLPPIAGTWDFFFMNTTDKPVTCVIREFMETRPDPTHLRGDGQWLGDGWPFVWKPGTLVESPAEHARYELPATLTRFLDCARLVNDHYASNPEFIGFHGEGDEIHTLWNLPSYVDIGSMLIGFERAYASGQYGFTHRNLYLWTVTDTDKGFYGCDMSGGGLKDMYSTPSPGIEWEIYGQPRTKATLQKFLAFGQPVWIYISADPQARADAEQWPRIVKQLPERLQSLCHWSIYTETRDQCSEENLKAIINLLRQ